jgi:hypothetical protein
MRMRPEAANSKVKTKDRPIVVETKRHAHERSFSFLPKTIYLCTYGQSAVSAGGQMLQKSLVDKANIPIN